VAMSDLLTGLKSRHQLHIELLSRAGQANAAKPLALLLLSVKDFALWQRQLTPLATDRLVQVAGELLAVEAPEEAFLARWNNACFALLLPNCPVWCAEDIGDQLRETARQTALPSLLSYQGLALDFNCGAATLPPLDANRLPQAAEEQLNRCEGGMFARLLMQSGDGNSDNLAAEAYIQLAELYLTHGDPYLKRHGQMTSGYALEVGRRLSFSPEALRELSIAAAFADIAMAEAAGSALNKPGNLTLGEYKRICRHPRFAAELCRSLSLSQGVIDTVLYHHERGDGSGYPEGLSAIDIPLSASVLGACGAFAAMLLPRPYRPARKLYAAKAELTAAADLYWPGSVIRELLTL